MAAVDDLVDALGRLEVELSCADEEAFTAGVAALARFRVRCDGLWLKLVGEVDVRGLHRRQGARDAATWLAGVAGERKGVSRRDVALAQRLGDAPEVAEAVTAGRVSKAKASELVRAGNLPEEVQEALLADAADLPVEQVAAAVERARLAYGEQDPPVTPELTITRRPDHAKVEGRLDLVGAETLDVALSAIIDAMGLPPDVPYAQRRARGLVGLARYYLDHQDQVTTRVGRPHVLVLVDLEVLEGRINGAATLASGAVISGEAARRLAQDANIARIVTKGRSEPLDVGRSTRSVPPALAKAVIARDRHCRYEGCVAPPWACDVHHRRPWADGGPTSLSNLGLLCWFHHELVHRAGAHRLRTAASGGWTVAPDQRDAAA